MTSENKTSLLAVIIDVNPVWWGQLDLNVKSKSPAPVVSFTKCVDSLIVFCNAFLMLSPLNKLCFIASHGVKNRFIYPRQQPEDFDMSDASSLDKDNSDGKYEKFAELDETIRDGIYELALDNSIKYSTDCVLTGALSMALCYINRINKEATHSESVTSRVLIIKGSRDHPSQYMDFMSIVFTAQKMNIVIDACALDNDSSLLKQACDMLDGTYLKLPNLSGLLEYLMYLYLPGCGVRDILSLPPCVHSGHKAACFCHRVTLDIGYVCSVCLSIYCSFSPICSTCQSTFRIAAPQRSTKKTLKK